MQSPWLTARIRILMWGHMFSLDQVTLGWFTQLQIILGPGLALHHKVE